MLDEVRKLSQDLQKKDRPWLTSAGKMLISTVKVRSTCEQLGASLRLVLGVFDRFFCFSLNVFFGGLSGATDVSTVFFVL